MSSISSSPKKYRFGFILSTSLGNLTRYQILRKYAERDPEIDFTWAPVKHYIAPGEVNPFARWPKFLQRRAIPIHQSWPVLGRLSSFDAILVHMYEVDILLAIRSYFRRRPLRVNSTDDAPVLDPATYPLHVVDARKSALKRAVRLRVDLWRARRVDAQIPLSPWAGDILIHGAGVPANRVTPIHVGVDLEEWPFVDRKQRVGATRKKILFVGGDFIRKGGALLLDVFDRSFAQTAELHLVTKYPIASQSPAVHVYNDLSPQDPRLVALYQACDVMALPTTADLSSWAALEAMASGCAVITTRSGGIRNLIDDGVTGLFVPPGDAAALERALRELIDDDDRRTAMVAKARASVEANFSAAVNVPRILSVMKALVRERRAA